MHFSVMWTLKIPCCAFDCNLCALKYRILTYPLKSHPVSPHVAIRYNLLVEPLQRWEWRKAFLHSSRFEDTLSCCYCLCCGWDNSCKYLEKVHNVYSTIIVVVGTMSCSRHGYPHAFPRVLCCIGYCMGKFVRGKMFDVSDVLEI